jgi:hypothetical protein
MLSFASHLVLLLAGVVWLSSRLYGGDGFEKVSIRIRPAEFGRGRGIGDGMKP